MDLPTSAHGQDAVLVRAAQAGDREAFGRLYERYGPMVHGLLLARVPHGDVDDLVQDVFLSALRQLRSLRAPEAFGGWLAAIARNRAVDHHRHPPHEALDEERHAAAEPPPAEALAVLGVIQSLPPAYRETLVLRLVEGMTGQDIADRTASRSPPLSGPAAAGRSAPPREDPPRWPPHPGTMAAW